MKTAVFILLLFIIAGWVSYPFILMHLSPVMSDDLGKFGDSFGALNTLFSGLAFVGLIYAILLQREDLRIQSKELELTRQELRAQRGEFAEQNATMRIQRFENTLFNMISMHNQILESIVIFQKQTIGWNASSEEHIRYSGSAAFRIIYEDFKTQYENERKSNKNDVESINNSYNNIFTKYREILPHYLRSLYRIFKFIDETNQIETKKFYTDIVRSKISDPELMILYYNVTVSPKGTKFLPLTKRYDLFDNINPHDFIHLHHAFFISK